MYPKNDQSAFPPESDGFPCLFSLLAFDWDGTAVASRRDTTEELRKRTTELESLGVWLVVITGTKYDNLACQYFDLLPRRNRSHHVACVNRGSEVYGFDEQGRRITLQRRVATEEENRKMDAVGVQIRNELAETYHLETAVVFDRLNRRKLDLIPEPQWSDPSRERIGELLTAVKRRLRRAGIDGGIDQVMQRVRELAYQEDIDLKLTTDVKHVEFGLTDKSDSVDYIARTLAPSHKISVQDIAILGDEFGPIDGFEGSDYKTCGLDGATYVSVGMEPNGVPDGVIHVGGGVGTFLAILDRQIELHRGRIRRK